MSLIELKNIEKKYKNKLVLEDISLSINEGEAVAFLGKNGAGKTTLVEIIAKFTNPTKGEVIINIEENQKQEIGIQFQEGNWPTGLCANDILSFYYSVFPKFTKDHFDKLDETFDIKNFLKTPLNKLSGGQKQRFNALLSVVNNPKIIILDELTTGLDLELQFKIINFFKNQIKNNKTLLIVSHHPEEVEKLCDRLILVDKNHIILDQPVKQVQNSYGSVRNLMEEFYKGNIS
ncbi:ABC transporter ATP-binding protein [Spiroplasma helicoides]|uniref:ABC transporter ATP-binding protein n=1 Tax=Spiroplasma helicoides TaxID=216938 RepID=A0A1B3SM76_9MOLU|nr:ABC transporter ATP-binding protein [Spiroplasma helicoides]AOG61034.1 ABC transporter ATP-binding protein [Spiroplasma helicoides]